MSTSEQARILVADDDRSIRRMLRLSLEGHGFAVVEAATANEALQGALATPPDLILLDLELPDFSGALALEQLRLRGQIPVIVISASAGEADKIRLLDAGADDYLTKPFSIGELLARIRVALRHGRAATPRDVLRLGALGLDSMTRTLHVGQSAVHLTPTECALLLLFLEHAGQAITRERILESIWEGGYNELNALRVHINQLRKKMGPPEGCGVALETLPGKGYRLSATNQRRAKGSI
ncbi:MAG: response regulator transcription factor [Leptospirales bacterium]|nr:response regulator transcription factor [Leptospirales bacterium]